MRYHRLHRLRLLAVVPALALLAAACNNEPSEVVPQVAGNWQGTYQQVGSASTVPLSIALQQSGKNVSGTLDIATYHFTLTGQVDASGLVQWATSQEDPNCVTIETDQAAAQRFGLMPGAQRLEGRVKVRYRTAGSGPCDGPGTFAVEEAVISVDKI